MTIHSESDIQALLNVAAYTATKAKLGGMHGRANTIRTIADSIKNWVGKKDGPRWNNITSLLSQEMAIVNHRLALRREERKASRNFREV